MSEDLAQIANEIWTTLATAATDSTHPWRLPVFATTAAGTPRVRTIVLRGVDRDGRTLFLHTDVRSPKVQHIENQKTVSLAFYDHPTGLQLVVQAHAAIHTSDCVADKHWSEAPASSRRAYLAPDAPGTPGDEATMNLPAHVVGRIPTEEELKPARENFAVISIHVETIDWLKLERRGNTRALFDYTGTAPIAAWTAP